MNYAVKMSRFVNKKEAKGLLSNSGIKTLWSKTPLLRPIKMNKIMNKFLLVDDTFMLEMHLK